MSDFQIEDFFLPRGQKRLSEFFPLPKTAKQPRPDEQEQQDHSATAMTATGTLETTVDADNPNFWPNFTDEAPEGWDKIEVIMPNMGCPRKIWYRRKPKLLRTFTEIKDLIPDSHPYWSENTQHEEGCACEVCKIVWETIDS